MLLYVFINRSMVSKHYADRCTVRITALMWQVYGVWRMGDWVPYYLSERSGTHLDFLGGVAIDLGHVFELYRALLRYGKGYTTIDAMGTNFSWIAESRAKPRKGYCMYYEASGND